MNFARDVLDRRSPGDLALLELARDGSRREWRFGEVSDRSARLAGALRARGIRKGDVVMTLVGNRPEWVMTMCACFRIGAVVLPCTEQLRAKDLRLRLAVARPQLIVADERNRAELESALLGGDATHSQDVERAGSEVTRARIRMAETMTQESVDTDAIPVLFIPDEALFEDTPAPAVELAPTDPCLITFTSGTSGEPKAVLHGQRYLDGQHLQAENWLGAKAGELVWCTAASGWSKSARNVFIAPWITGASALLHDARFDPATRLDLLARERVNVLCMAPTEYRVIAARATLRALPDLRAMVAAGEALNPEVLHAWREATGLEIRDGYGQTETGQMTGMPLGEPARPGSMGRALPGVRLSVNDGELIADPASVPTFFLGYLGEGVERRDDGAWRIEDRAKQGASDAEAGTEAEADGMRGAGNDKGANGAGASREVEPWHTGDRVREDDDGYLWFEGRSDDVIVSAGYRIGPFEVESALVAHPAVAEAAAVAAPDAERGAVVRAVVVLREGHTPSPELARELQEHVKAETAPYKYPRIVDFANELPKTASGKIKRAELRER